MGSKTKQKLPANGPKTGWSRLIELSATKKPLIITAVILSVLASIASFIPYMAIYMIIREILTVYPQYDLLNTTGLLNYGWIAFGGIIANILLYFFALICSHLAAFGTLYELKVNFSTHLAKVPLGFHVIAGSGKLRKIMDENIEKIETFIAHQLPDIVASIVAPFVMIIILLTIDWRFGLASLAAMIAAFFIQIRAYGNQGAKEMMHRYQRTLEEMNNASVEYVRGISVVKAFRQTVYSFQRLHKTIKAYTEMVIPYTLSWENFMSAFTTIINNVYLFLLPVGILIGMNTSNYRSFVSIFIFYLIFVPSIASIMMKCMYVMSSGIQIMDGVAAMDSYLAHPPLSIPTNPRRPDCYDIVFDNVSFSYTGDEETTALENVSFTAKQKEITAVVGPSGGGKSTIAHLIPRFFDVNSGKITIGGVDIRDMDNKELMENISFVFQDVFLFKQSVMDNIRLGNPLANDEQVIQAAKAAQCHDFIEKLPQSYQTVIGTKGVHLSGGEKQRIAIARAIVKDAPIIVLDEATAFADPENEHLIQQAFESLMKNKTVLMIAHRLSTIQGANNIIVMENGRVIQQGTHNTLSKQEGRYKNMWETYIQTVSWSIKRKEAKTNG